MGEYYLWNVYEKVITAISTPIKKIIIIENSVHFIRIFEFYYSKIIEIECTIGSPDKDYKNKIHKKHSQYAQACHLIDVEQYQSKD